MKEAAEWYEARGQGLGAEFLRALDAALSAIARAPLANAVVIPGVRRAAMRRFPYSIIYAMEMEDILIVACIHGRRDPKRWQARP